MTSTSAKTSLSNVVQEAATRPRDCSLLICVPLRKEQFLEDLKPDSAKDFTKNFRRGREALSNEGLWRLYEPYALLALDVIEEVKHHGVEVLLDTTAKGFASALLKREVTTLVAHSRSPMFRADDVREVAKRAKESGEEFTRIAGFSCEGLPLMEIAARLNKSLETNPQAQAYDGGAANPGDLARRIAGLHRRRMSLERQLPGYFRGGSAVEFADGLLHIESVVASVPKSFSGILDLTVCNSILLGEEIRNKCDHALVFRNEGSASFDFRFAAYRQVIRALVQKPQSFTDAIIGVRKLIDGLAQ